MSLRLAAQAPSTFVESYLRRLLRDALELLVDGGFGEHSDEARELHRRIEEATHRNRKTLVRPAP